MTPTPDELERIAEDFYEHMNASGLPPMPAKPTPTERVLIEVLHDCRQTMRAFWTPQRRAFYEAAEAHGRKREHAERHDSELCFCCCHTEEVLVDRYRAMLESERGEGK